MTAIVNMTITPINTKTVSGILDPPNADCGHLRLRAVQVFRIPARTLKTKHEPKPETKNPK
jgi:hypothetical protein